MPEVKLDISKSEMKAMEEAANDILMQQGKDPEVYRYEQNLRLVTENMKLLLKRGKQHETKSV
ncbi:hypothetical protein NHG25_06020 [Aerococcaceae bacterium NML191292]|nr:hypothetical protein [Aerococcaceae bacterium NML191292]